MFANNSIKLDLRESDVSSDEFVCRHKNVSFLFVLQLLELYFHNIHELKTLLYVNESKTNI